MWKAAKAIAEDKPEKSKWIEFRLTVKQPKSAITKVWHVLTTGGSQKEVGGILLGTVRWWGAWRKYAFFPGPATLYEPTCLRDLADFCEAQTVAQRERRTA